MRRPAGGRSRSHHHRKVIQPNGIAAVSLPFTVLSKFIARSLPFHCLSLSFLLPFHCPFTVFCPVLDLLLSFSNRHISRRRWGVEALDEDREKEPFFKEAVKEVSFLVLVHDRTLERPRLVKASLDGAVGRAGQLSEVFANTLRFKDGDTADGLALLGRLAFDASKLNPYAGVEWDKKTHIASFFNDTPLASAFSDGTDEKELEGLYNLLVGTLHHCVHGSTGFVPTKAELLRLRRFVCGEEG